MDSSALEKRVAEIEEAGSGERDRLIGELLCVANQDRDAFIAAVRGLPIARLSPLFWCYEAVASDPVPWTPFVVEEIDRHLAAMDAIDFGSDLLLTMLPLTAVSDDGPRREMIEAVIAWSRSESAKVRRSVAELLASLDNPSSAESRDVLTSYTSDPDWRVRVSARQTLNEDEGGLPTAGIGLLDRARLRLFDQYSWK
jgi:hypothetical protein